MDSENNNDRTGQTEYFLPKVEIKGYNVMIDGKSLLDQTVKSDMRTYNNIRKNSTGKGNDYTTGCLLDYTHFKDDSNRFK